MKLIVVIVLALLLTACDPVSKMDIELAEDYCKPYGGWKLVDRQDILCAGNNAVDYNSTPVSRWVSHDEARREIWERNRNKE